MANYGKILTPIGLVITIIGIGISSINGMEMVGSVLGVPGLILLAIGLVRLVQGKDRKIMGQILRPKAAARSSAIWMLYIYNLTPFLFPGSRIMYYSPPFPLAIWIGGYNQSAVLGYQWVPFVTILFLIVWLIGLILSGRHPKSVNIFFKTLMVICFSFWLNFGVQFLLWTFVADKTGLFFFDNWVGATTIQDLRDPLLLSAAIVGISAYLLIRVIKKLGEAYDQIVLKGAKKMILFSVMIFSYIIGLLPLYFGIQLSLANQVYLFQYVQFIGLIIIAAVMLVAITTLMNSMKELNKQRAGEGKTAPVTSFGISTAIFLVIFFISWAPMFLPLIDHGQNTKNNSIYNPSWNGWSNFRDELENQGYEIKSIQSSISVISELDQSKQIILVIGGPNKFYNPASEVPFFLSAFKTNFSMFICEDHGTVESLLFEMFAASLGKTPVTFIPKGVLRDNESYWKNPTFPVITNFASGDITDGVSKVVLSSATAFLGGEFLAGMGWNIIGTTSAQYSFVDVNNDGKFEQTVDTYKITPAVTKVMQDQGGGYELAGDILDLGIPLGGYPQAVFSVKEVAAPGTPLPSGNGTYASRVFVGTDATWLDNELTSISDFDNMQLGLNIMKYLACGRDPEDVIIVFDEAHILPESHVTEISSAATFGAIQGYVNWLSTNPILGLFYPLFALSSLRKWIPKEEEKKKLQLRDLEEAERAQKLLKFRTSSYFARKINFYRTRRRYKQALLRLYTRLQRKINALLGNAGQRDVNAIMIAIQTRSGKKYTKDILKEIREFLEKIEALKQNKATIKDEDEFLKLFQKMSWVSDKI